MFHQVRFSADGYWEHSGGIYGKSLRSQAVFRWSSFTGRIAEESRRISVVRKIAPEGADVG
jgi:hypothetical protein